MTTCVIELIALEVDMITSLGLVLALAADAGTGDVRLQYERWERRLRDKIAERHIFPGGADRNAVGDVVIRFAIGPDGRPVDPVIQQSSGNPVFDRAAQRVVRLLGPVGPVPSLAGTDHGVAVKLSYGKPASQGAERRLAHALEAERKSYDRRNLQLVTSPAIAASLPDRQEPQR
jgi:TonB family protein